MSFLRRRKEWFAPMETPMQVLWWVDESHIPTVSEAKDRLEYLSAHGPTAHAFTFRTAVQFVPRP